MKDLGLAKRFLGININQNIKNGIIEIDQSDYIIKILNRFKLFECNPAKTPMDLNVKLDNTSENNDRISSTDYQEMIGSLMYLCQISRPDICFAVNCCSRFNNNPTNLHLTAVKRIYRYLKGTADYKLVYRREADNDITAFTDSDWANNEATRHSVTGNIFIMQGGAISWCSKKQRTVALSTTEAEYMAMSNCAQEAIWLKNFINEIDKNLLKNPVKIYCDNKSAIDLLKVNTIKQRSKHIDIRYHFTKEKIETGEIIVNGVGTEEMVADYLTKPVGINKHKYCIEKSGMKFDS